MARRGMSAYDELLRAVAELGYPEEFGVVLAGELRSDNAMSRMASYLRQAQPQSPEEIADEMLAICSQRDAWVERKKSQWAESRVNEFYNRPRE